MSRQEKLVIIFLLACIIAGLGVSFYKKAHLPEIKVTPSYIEKESAFLETKTLSARLVNINTADEKELTHLPGIGPALAKNIITYRQEEGFFSFPEEIIKVPGIGKNKYENIKDFITTEDEPR